MNTIFVSILDGNPEYPGYAHARIMADRYAGGQVHHLTEKDAGSHDREMMGIMSRRKKSNENRRNSIRQYLIALDYILANNLKPPFAFPDWDVLIFEDMEESFAPFAGFEWTTAIFADGGGHAAFSVHSIDALGEFRHVAMELADGLDDGMYVNHFHDMLTWSRIRQSRPGTVGNAIEIHNGRTFCPGMHATRENETIYGYEKDADGYKTLTWEKGKPFFRTLDGRLVGANWVHCWGRYKSRTGELLAMSENK